MSLHLKPGQLTLADLRQSLQSASVNLAKGALYGEGRVSTLSLIHI